MLPVGGRAGWWWGAPIPGWAGGGGPGDTLVPAYHGIGPQFMMAHHKNTRLKTLCSNKLSMQAIKHSPGRHVGGSGCHCGSPRASTQVIEFVPFSWCPWLQRNCIREPTWNGATPYISPFAKIGVGHKAGRDYRLRLSEFGINDQTFQGLTLVLLQAMQNMQLRI